MTTYTKTELDLIVELNRKWRNGEPDGKRADLKGADLCGANLCGADLCGANLRGADFTDAKLQGVLLWDDIKNSGKRYNLITPKNKTQHQGKMFKVKATDKIGLITTEEVFQDWFYGILGGKIVFFEMDKEVVEVLE